MGYSIYREEVVWISLTRAGEVYGGGMTIQCTVCNALVLQAKNRDGPNFCPNCNSLFVPVEKHVPPWILGVLVFLMGNLQVISQR
jgi:hypothetical protein